MEPAKAARVGMPADIFRSSDRLSQTSLEQAVTYDVNQHLRKAAAITYSVPSIGAGKYAGGLWSTKTFQLVANHDAYCPATFPQVLGTGAAAVPHQWTCSGVVDSLNGVGPVCNEPPEVTHMTFETGFLCSSASDLIDGTVTRPISARPFVAGYEDRQWFWVDAYAPKAGETATTVELLIRATFHDFSLDAATSYFNFTVALTRLDEDGAGEFEVNDTSTANPVLDVPGNVGIVGVNVAFTVTRSGFYSIKMGLALVDIVHTTSYVQQIVVSPTITIKEYSPMVTTFLTDSTVSVLPFFAHNVWVNGASALLSFRSPQLVAGGTILAVNFGRVTQSWTLAVQAGAQSMLARSNIHDGYNGSQGGALQNGVFGWSKLGIWPRRMWPTTGNTEDEVFANKCPLAYVVPGMNCIDGGMLFELSPSATDTDARIDMRFDFARKITFCPSTKLIQGHGDIPILLSDQVDSMMIALSRIDNFSTNDFHDTLKRWAAKAANIAAGVIRAAEFGSKVASTVAML